MRTIRRIYYAAHAARLALARFYASDLMLPIFAATCSASGILLSVGIMSRSPSTVFVGALVAAGMATLASIGRAAFLADIRETRAMSASTQHAYEVASRALREAFRSMADVRRGDDGE